MDSLFSRLVFCALACWLMGSPAMSNAQTGSETLLVAPPRDWDVATNRRDRGLSVVQYVPPGQTLEDWDDMVQVQIFHGLVDLGPSRFLSSMLANYSAVCAPVGASEPEFGRDSPFPSATQMMLCGRNADSNLGEVALFKAIQGRESLYAVARVWRGIAFELSAMPLGERVLADWAALLDRVRLCDNADPAAPCPVPGGSSGNR